MINLFQITERDASMDYLSRIFGSVSGVITTPIHPVGEINILSVMFKVFNGVILTVAVLMLIYVTVVGVIQTAHEGEFMGKRWNNIWIPIRAVFGFALLVPTGAGYCAIQILIMWVVVQGVGAADVLWNTALSYINLVGTYPQIQVKPMGAGTTFTSLFQGLVCDGSSNFNGKNPADPSHPDAPGGYYCTAQRGRPCNFQPVKFTPRPDNKLQLGPNGNCGIVTYCNEAEACNGQPPDRGPNSLPCMSCKAQKTALTAVVPTLSGIALEMVKADYSYRDFWVNSAKPDYKGTNWSWIQQYCASKGISPANCCHMTESQAAFLKAMGISKTCTNELPSPDAQSGERVILQDASEAAVKNLYWPFWPQLAPNLGLKTQFIQSGVDYYSDQLQGALTSFIATQGQDGKFSKNIKAAQENGWILAGAFYFMLANQTGKDFSQAMPFLEWAPPKETDVLTKYRNNYSAARFLVEASIEQGEAGTQPVKPGQPKVARIRLFKNVPGLSSIDNELNTGLQNVTANIAASTVGGGTNPLLWMAITGQVFLAVASGIFLGILIALAIAAPFGYISVFVLGSGFINPIGPTISLLMMWVIPLIYGILGIMVAAGGLLGVYVPLIPFVIFAFGAIGWMISVVEAMVAGPLVALGIISPSGSHEILGKAEPALMLLFNIFLRPTLMIFGLIAAMLVATVVAAMINHAMWNIIYNVGSASGWSGVAMDPIGLVLFLIVYVTITIAALNKCFALINLLPQQVMRWISGQAEAVEGGERELKGAVETGAAGARGAIAGSEEARGVAARAEKAEGPGGAIGAKKKT